MQHLLRVRDLVTYIDQGTEAVRAVDEVSLDVHHGEAVAIVGESGSGKSMTVVSIMGLQRSPVRVGSGSVYFAGRDLRACSKAELAALRGIAFGAVFQDPMTYLNPVLRIETHLAEAYRRSDFGSPGERIRDVLTSVGIADTRRVLDSYPHQLSGGMRQRILIGMALVNDPQLLIADEPTTALDVTTQAQVMRLISRLLRDKGSSLLLVTHDLGLVSQYCDRVYVMYAGRVVESGGVREVFRHPQHPYTRALLASTMSAHFRVDAFRSIGGAPPTPSNMPPGCRFNPRCTERLGKCGAEEPILLNLGGYASSRCWLVADHAQ